MTLKELNNMLKTTGFPVAYREFESSVSFPAIAYYERDSNNLFADGVSYFVQTRKTVELYTDMKDPDSEAKLEGIFLSNNVAWEKSETKIDDEHCYLIEYEIEV